MTSILLSGFATIGGSGLIASKLGLELDNRDYDVHFMANNEPFHLKEKNVDNRVKFHKVDDLDYALFKDIGSPYTITAAEKMIKIVERYDIDVVHTHYSLPHAVVAYLTKLKTGVKVVSTTHGSDTHTLGKSKKFNSIIGMALENSDCVTSVSKFLAESTKNIFDLSMDVKTIHNFIDPSEFKPLREERRKSIIQASNFRPIKQLPFMLEMFAGVSKDFPDWNLDLIGYGPDYPICMRKAKALKIRDKVKFLGVRNDIPIQIAKASILGSTSKIESFGLTIAEAMSCETPVIAPNVGGIPEICVNNENGNLYESGNLVDGTNKLRDLIEDEEKRRRYGENSRKRILDKFTPEIIVKKYEDVYENIL